MSKNVVMKGIRFATDPKYRFNILAGRGFYDGMSDEKYLKRRFKIIMGKELDLENPQTFNEKLQWLKLYDRKPEYTMMVDKYKVREYIAKVLDEKYLIPLLGVWKNPEEIDFDILPDKFVLKCNHNSGLGMCVCKEKDKLDKERTIKNLRIGLTENHYFLCREWAYKDVEPCVIAEKFMVDENLQQKGWQGLLDYKFYCFNGEPRFLYVGYANIKNNIKQDMLSFYDLNWKKTPFYRIDHQELPFEVECPEKFEEMIDIAKKLSNGIPFVRVDLYYINKRIYFSELTFCPGGGYGEFSPYEWEKQIGSWIQID